MALIRFIFSRFWIWLGFIIMVYLVLENLTELVKAIRPPKRLESYQMGDVWRFNVDGASLKDIKAIAKDIAERQPVDAKAGDDA